MSKKDDLVAFIKNNPALIGKVVDFDRHHDRALRLDFTTNNLELTPNDIADTAVFTAWVNAKLQQHHCRYGIGGYFEHRTLYARSQLFDVGPQPRFIHLGVDIWGATDTPVYAPLAGKVHSFTDNDNFGDYGPTIILEHQLNHLTLYTLYGHLNRAALTGLYEGKPVLKNDLIAHFGDEGVNGSWPPHLHFQLMFDMEGRKGDYPGVCSLADEGKYFLNVADPALLLQIPDDAIL